MKAKLSYKAQDTRSSDGSVSAHRRPARCPTSCRTQSDADSPEAAAPTVLAPGWQQREGGSPAEPGEAAAQRAFND